jgi:Domain of unknown function (DUF4333)/Protein of unknown function (DUF2510)
VNQVPPGWYQDPQGAGQRYWDGTAWTEHVAPAQAAAPIPQPQSPYPAIAVAPTGRSGGGNTGKIVGAIIGVIVIIVGVVALIGALSGTKIDPTKAQNLVRSHINGAQSVKCPSGIEAKSGRTFDCKVTLTDGSTETVTLHIKDDRGNAEFSQSDVRRP